MTLFEKIKKILNKEIVLLSVIIAWGAFLRLYYLGADSLWIDEGFTIAQVDAISENFLPLLDSGHYINRDLFLPYLLAAIKFIGGGSIEAYRLVSAIFGILCIPLAYAIGKEIFQKNAGLILASLISFSYWQIAWSRQIRAYILLEFLLLLTIFFLIKYHRTQKKKFLLFLLFSTGLAISAKVSAVFILPALLIYFLTQKNYKTSTIFTSIFVILGFLGYFYFRKDFPLSLNNYFFYYFIGYFWLNLGLIFPLSIVGAYWTIYHDKYWRSVHLFILSFFFLNLFFFSFFYYVNQKRYLFVLLPVIFIYAVSFLHYLIKEKKIKLPIAVLLISLFLVIDFFSVKSMQVIPQKKFLLEAYTPQPDFQSAYKFLEKSLKPEDSLISPYPYIDKIYLNRPSYALAISYTGKEDNESITRDKKEYYSGAPEISSIGRIDSLREKGDVYIILDTMAQSRANRKIVQYANEYFSSESILFESSSGDTLTIYRLPILEDY
ncbi:MAG: glycosyltransferase family 39 protein [Candidatus Moraniibacteriota bacterium]